MLTASHGRPPEDDFTGALKEFLFVSKIDCLILGDPLRGTREIIPVAYSTFVLPGMAMG